MKRDPRAMKFAAPYVKGREYVVPVIRFGVTFKNVGVFDGRDHKGGSLTIGKWEGYEGALPVMMDTSVDEDYVGRALPEKSRHHAHVLWEFMPEEHFRRFLNRWGTEGLRTNVPMFEEAWLPYVQQHIELMPCLRTTEELGLVDFSKAYWIRQLRDTYACARLTDGRCPHRGTPVQAMIRDGDVLTCPGHGLRFNAKTGVAIP